MWFSLGQHGQVLPLVAYIQINETYLHSIMTFVTYELKKIYILWYLAAAVIIQHGEKFQIFTEKPSFVPQSVGMKGIQL